MTIQITHIEKAELQDEADRAGLTLNNLIRQKCGLPLLVRGGQFGNRGNRKLKRKLGPERAKEIREKYASGKTTMHKLAHIYCVSVTTIWQIIHNKKEAPSER